MTTLEYVTDRAQGGDAELLAMLNVRAAEGWELDQLIPAGSTVSTSPTAEGSWLAVFHRKRKGK